MSLIYAAMDGNIKGVRKSLEKGVDVNTRNDYGQTALWWALYKGHLEIAKLLIEKGADVNAIDNSGKTALMFASEAGTITADLLIEKGVCSHIS